MADQVNVEYQGPGASISGRWLDKEFELIRGEAQKIERGLLDHLRHSLPDHAFTETAASAAPSTSKKADAAASLASATSPPETTDTVASSSHLSAEVPPTPE